jgi:hypothetical protein
MGWSIGWSSTWRRDIGYGVPAWCDHPECKAEIDRGLAYLCGGQTWGSDHGCGLYFCEKHLSYTYAKDEDDGGDDGEGYYACPRCTEIAAPYEPKPDHPDWIKHKLTDPSWERWRQENPAEVSVLRALHETPNPQIQE